MVTLPTRGTSSTVGKDAEKEVRTVVEPSGSAVGLLANCTDRKRVSGWEGQGRDTGQRGTG